MPNIAYMQEALKQAQEAYHQDEVPVGAVIIFKNQIIARAHNHIETFKDATAHAEMIAITQAMHYLDSKWLYDCTMYVTLEPCSMCAGALVLSRIQNVVFGAKDFKTGACGSVFNIVNNNQLNHKVNVQGGILKEECRQLIQDFFKQKRKDI